MQARSSIESSRKSVAQMINANPEDIMFTSGGTEANNIALFSAVKWAKVVGTKPHVIASNVEHDSVAKFLADMQNLGEIDLSFAEVSKATGNLDPDAVTSLIRNETCLVSVMHANNETGLLMPIKKIGVALKTLNIERLKNNLPKILFHTDAAQSLGKVRVDVQELGMDYLTIVGHKFYGPRIGALFANCIGDGTPVLSMLHGGGQERGFRSGTENTPMISGLGQASSLVVENIEEYIRSMEICRDYLATKLKEQIPGVSMNFIRGIRLPNTLSIQVPSGQTSKVVLEKCRGKVLASLGAACHSNTGQPSGVLISSGLSPEEAQKTLRLSVGRTTSLSEMDLAVEALVEACEG